MAFQFKGCEMVQIAWGCFLPLPLSTNRTYHLEKIETLYMIVYVYMAVYVYLLGGCV